MAFQLVGVYDGTEEAKVKVRTRYRPSEVLNETKVSIGSLSALSGLGESEPGAGGRFLLAGISVLVGVCTGYLLGKKACR